MPKVEERLRRITKFICLFGFAVIFSGFPGALRIMSQTKSRMVEGKDYIELKRVRILDEMGFDRPVEAMSLLVPNGWKVEGGVRWKGVNECRGEIVTHQISISSPDGAIQILALPAQSFVYSQDQMMNQSLMIAARQGGCRVSAPFTAKQYLENLARTWLKADVSNIRVDESVQGAINKINSVTNAGSNGTGTQSAGTGVYGMLNWSDGSKGLAQIGVMVMTNQSTGMFTGTPNGFASTIVFHQLVLKYAPSREAEAIKLFGGIIASSRTNPIWKQAKEDFLTRLGNAEHAQRMDRIRLMGEQSRAYAKAQSNAADTRMRDWERTQSSSDASQRRFIQTIREVETWKDGNGNSIELSSGYNYGWSKPDGSYILTNNSLFNPAVELQQNWTRMQKPN